MEKKINIAESVSDDGFSEQKLIDDIINKQNQDLLIISKSLEAVEDKELVLRDSIARRYKLTWVGKFKDGIARFSIHDDIHAKYGLVDTGGQIKITPTYRFIDSFQNGLARAMKEDSRGNELWGFINQEGDEVIPCMYETAQPFSDGLARVRLLGKRGYINYNAEFKALPEVEQKTKCNTELSLAQAKEEIVCLEKELFRVKEHRKEGVTDHNGLLIVPCEYDCIGSFSNGLAKVQKDSKWGFINTQGDIVIPLVFDDVGNFSDGCAPVGKKSSLGYGMYDWGFINKKGELVYPLKCRDVWSFYDGVAKVERYYYPYGWDTFYIDTKGQRVFSPEPWDRDDF